MTNKQKIAKQKMAILKKMKMLLKDRTEGCFCFAYDRARDGTYKYMSRLISGVLELGLRPPKKTFNGLMWYAAYDPIRIKKIDQLIKRLSK